MRALLATVILLGCGGPRHDKTMDAMFAESGGGMCGCGVNPEPGTLAVTAPPAAQVMLDGQAVKAGTHVLAPGAHRLTAVLPDQSPPALELDAHPDCRQQASLTPEGRWTQTLACENTLALLAVAAAPSLPAEPADPTALPAWAATVHVATGHYLESFRLALAAAIAGHDIILVSLWRDLEVRMTADWVKAAGTLATDGAALRAIYQHFGELAGRTQDMAIDCWCADWSRGAPLPRAQLVIMARADALAPLRIVSAELRVDGAAVLTRARGEDCTLAPQAMGYVSQARHVVDVELGLAATCGGPARVVRVRRELDIRKTWLVTARVVARGAAIDLHVTAEP